MSQVRTQISVVAVLLLVLAAGCEKGTEQSDGTTPSTTHDHDPAPSTLSAADILGSPDHLAFSYGGYRETTRQVQPTIEQIKEDLRILSAMGVKLLRTYNTQQFKQAARLLDAIHELRQEDPAFEMYVMLGAWIDCEGAWTEERFHDRESLENNTAEINAAVALANAHPETVKIIAVGNEAMVHWATYYFVQPSIILRWVEHLQGLRATGDLPAEVWITSSDNFASWGGEPAYHNDDLVALIKAVDFVSLHTYPFHDTHYNRLFWGVPEEETGLSTTERADAAMRRATAHAKSQYQVVADYIAGLGIEKPIHIGETGWASKASSSYGASGSQAADEYKGKRYYEAMREWTNNAGMSCFYFEAFDEPWKDQNDPGGSENHFGLINLQGQAKYALWDLVDAGAFDGLTRGGMPITKTYGGNEDAMIADLLVIPALSEMGKLEISTVNPRRDVGQVVTEQQYVVFHDTMTPSESNDMTYPSHPVRLNVWEGSCTMEFMGNKIQVTSGVGDWWGCALEIQGTESGENLTQFASGRMHFEVKGDAAAAFDIGFQTGRFLAGTQTNNHVSFAPGTVRELTDEWASFSIPVAELSQGADLADVTSVLYLRGTHAPVNHRIDVRSVYFTRE